MRIVTYILIGFTSLNFMACKNKAYELTGSIERLDPELNTVVDEDAKIEIIATGYTWSEGPLWVEPYHMLLFSDVPANTVYKWTEEKGAEVYFTPSGYTGTSAHYSNEPGSNGLTLDAEGKLVLCQHGNRQIARMDAPLNALRANFIVLAGKYDDKKFNSPNDAVYRSNGDLYITDPSYGLPNHEEDSTRETKYNGVYRITPNGQVSLLIDSITHPNGIAFLPGYKTIIVANSDSDNAIWYAYDISDKDSLTNARIFYNATTEAKTENGSPDGFKVDSQGHVFASGPGGVWIFNSAAKVLGKIKLTEPASNCALSADERTLYVTSKMNILRIKLRK